MISALIVFVANSHGLGATPVDLPDNEALKTMRHQFQAAEQALKKGQITRFNKLKNKLVDYPLYPYLEYQWLKKTITRAAPDRVTEYIDSNAGSPTAVRLQSLWLRQLYRQKKWSSFVNLYTSSNNTKMVCKYAYALHKTGQDKQAFKLIDSIWLTGKSLPRQCDLAITAWKNAGQMTKNMLWLRIRLAMQKGQVRLARHLATSLPKNEQFWVNLWAKVRRDPSYLTEIQKHFENRSSPVLGWITVYGVRRMARRKPMEAAALWQKLQQGHPYTSEEQERVERRLALSLLKENNPLAQQWIQTLRLNRLDDKVIGLHFFAAMQDHDWELALEWMERLTREQKHTEQWRYWRGRVLEAMGRLEQARSVYVINGESRGYYSFLAADRAGQSYRFANKPLRYEKKDLYKVSAVPAIQRAKELIALQRRVQARREWNFAISHLPKEQQLKAAKLAGSWGWHNRAISTLAEARYWDDLILRFPLAHRTQVLSQSSQQNVNPAWAFAIIRQESAFTADARSHAGALGLMQLLPGTARYMAKTMRIKRPRYYDILQANTNIKLGVRYLKKMQDHYQGNSVLATAAYNAGSRNVKRWLPEIGTIPADIWIEKVPFKETRNYLKRILTYTAIYEQRLGLDPVPLLERMAPIGTSTLSATKVANNRG
jgi:soluble lytic murein transglycosylase